MNKELRALLAQISAKKEQAQAFVNEKKMAEAKALLPDIQALSEQYEILAALQTEMPQFDEGDDPSAKASVDEKRAFFAALAGKATPEMLAALTTSTDADGGYLVPKDIQTKINEIKRQYKSLKELVNVYPTKTKSGSFVYEDLTNLTNLVNFDESGTDLDSTNQPKFTQVPYTIKNYGALLPVSNILLQDETGGLETYIAKWFAKKAIRTENTIGFAALKVGKTVKPLADWKALKKSLNIDLDPMVATGAICITNQEGFDFLDSVVDSTGRPILQTSVADETRKLFNGKVIHVFSNAELPSVGTTPTRKVPIFYGSIEDGLTYPDRGVYEMAASTHAGFKNNQTLIRCIERIDAIQTDSGAYVYGEFTI